MESPLIERRGRVVGGHGDEHVVVRLSVQPHGLCLVPKSAFRKQVDLDAVHDINLIAVKNEEGVQSVTLSDGTTAEAEFVSSGTVWTTTPVDNDESNKEENPEDSNKKEDKMEKEANSNVADEGNKEGVEGNEEGNKEVDEAKAEEEVEVMDEGYSKSEISSITDSKKSTSVVSECIQDVEMKKSHTEVEVIDSNEKTSKGSVKGHDVTSVEDVLDYEPLEVLDHEDHDDENVGAAIKDINTSSADAGSGDGGEKKDESNNHPEKKASKEGKPDIKDRLGQRDPGSGNFLEHTFKSHFFNLQYAGYDQVAAVLPSVTGKIVEVRYKKGIAKLEGQKDGIDLEGQYAVFWKSNSFFKCQTCHEDSFFELMFKVGQKITMNICEAKQGMDAQSSVKYAAIVSWKGAKPTPHMIKSLQLPIRAKLMKVDPARRFSGVAEIVNPMVLRGKFVSVNTGCFIGLKGVSNNQRDLTSFVKINKTVFSLDTTPIANKTILDYTVNFGAQQCWLGRDRPIRQIKKRQLVAKDVLSRNYSVYVLELIRPSNAKESTSKGIFVIDTGVGASMSNQLLKFDRSNLVVFGHRLDKTDLQRLLRPGEKFEVEISPTFDPKANPPYPIKTAWIGPKDVTGTDAINTQAFKDWLKDVALTTGQFLSIVKGTVGLRPFFPFPVESQRGQVVALYPDVMGPSSNNFVLGVLRLADGAHAFFDRSFVYLFGMQLRKADLGSILPIGSMMRCEVSVVDLSSDQRMAWHRRLGTNALLGAEVNREAYLVYHVGGHRPTFDMMTRPLPKTADLSNDATVTKYLKSLSISFESFMSAVKGVAVKLPQYVGQQKHSSGVLAPWSVKKHPFRPHVTTAFPSSQTVVAAPQIQGPSMMKAAQLPTPTPASDWSVRSTATSSVPSSGNENPVIMRAKELLADVMQCTSPKDPNVGRIITNKRDHELSQFIYKTLEKASQLFVEQHEKPKEQKEQQQQYQQRKEQQYQHQQQHQQQQQQQHQEQQQQQLQLRRQQEQQQLQRHALQEHSRQMEQHHYHPQQLQPQSNQLRQEQQRRNSSAERVGPSTMHQTYRTMPPSANCPSSSMTRDRRVYEEETSPSFGNRETLTPSYYRDPKPYTETAVYSNRASADTSTRSEDGWWPHRAVDHQQQPRSLLPEYDQGLSYETSSSTFPSSMSESRKRVWSSASMANYEYPEAKRNNNTQGGRVSVYERLSGW